MYVIWTKHARERQIEWEKRKGITRQDVVDVVEGPEQVVLGDRGAFVAQSRKGQGLLRVPFIEAEGKRKILTVYWTSYVQRYWKEDNQDDADSV